MTTSKVRVPSSPRRDLEEKEPLQIRLPVGVKRRFKAHAAMRGLEPNELFVEVWDHYERTSSGRPAGVQGLEA